MHASLAKTDAAKKNGYAARRKLVAEEVPAISETTSTLPRDDALDTFKKPLAEFEHLPDAHRLGRNQLQRTGSRASWSAGCP